MGAEGSFTVILRLNNNEAKRLKLLTESQINSSNPFANVFLEVVQDTEGLWHSAHAAEDGCRSKGGKNRKRFTNEVTRRRAVLPWHQPSCWGDSWLLQRGRRRHSQTGEYTSYTSGIDCDLPGAAHTTERARTGRKVTSCRRAKSLNNPLCRSHSSLAPKERRRRRRGEEKKNLIWI